MTPRPDREDENFLEQPETPTGPLVTNDYEGVARQEPARAVSVPVNQPSLEDSINAGGDLSDMQVAVRRAFPSKWSPENIMIGRIAPEVFLSFIQMRVINRVMMADSTKPIDVTEIISEEYVSSGIGLDGCGRIDLAAFAGAAREDKFRRMQAGNGGLPGAM
jgi:hypothetical protein